MSKHPKKLDVNKMTKFGIAMGVLLIGLSFFYYFVIFLPQKEQVKVKRLEQEEQKEKEIELTKLKNFCLEKYEKARDELDGIEAEGLAGCAYTGVCTHEQFLKAGNPPIEDWRTPEFKNKFISNCMAEYGPISP